MTIVHKKSSVSRKRPKSTDLVPGELAINTADGSIFLKRDDGEVDSVNGPCSVTASEAAPTAAPTVPLSYAHLASFECDTARGDYNGIFILSLNASEMRCSTIFSIYLRVNGRVNGILVDPTINIDIHSSTPNELPTGPDDIYITYNTPATATDKCKFELWIRKTKYDTGKISLIKLSSSSNLSKTFFTEKFNNTPLNNATVKDPLRLDGVPWLSSLSSPLPKVVQSKLKDLSDSISPLYWNTSEYDVDELEPGQRVLCGSSVINAPFSNNFSYIESKKTYSTGSNLQIAYEYGSPTNTNLRFAIRHQRNSDGWSNWTIFESQQKNEERERVKVADRATHELLPCVYNPVNKTLVQAAPYSHEYANVSSGIIIEKVVSIPVSTTDTSISHYGATMKIPAALVGELRDTIFHGTTLNSIEINNGTTINLTFDTHCTWVEAKDSFTLGSNYYEVTIKSTMNLSSCESTNIKRINYTNKVLLLGDVLSYDITNKTITFNSTSAVSKSLIGVGALVKSFDGRVNIGYVKSNVNGKLTLAEIDSGLTEYNNLTNNIRKKTLRISNPITTYPDIPGGNISDYTVSSGTKLLVKDQILKYQNGLYTFKEGDIENEKPYVLTRTDDFDRGSLVYGSSVRVVSGYSGDILFKNNINSSIGWNHAATNLSFEENGVFSRGTITTIVSSNSITLENCVSVNNVTFKINGTTANYYITYYIRTNTIDHLTRKSISTDLSSSKNMTQKITTPSQIIYEVRDHATNSVQTSLPAGITSIDYVIYGYGA